MVWLKRALLALAVLALLLIGGGLLLPASVHVERTVVVNVPESQVFAMVNSFERFNEWSPWAQLDPNTRYEFAGPGSGVGAIMRWQSDDPSVGSGSQEIIESTAPTLVRARLLFNGQDEAISFHRLTPMEAGTELTWGFDANFGYDLVGRWVGYLMLDGMIGADYEKGLARLKTVLEQAPVPPMPAPAATETPAANPEAVPDTTTTPAATG